jgi:hypothetical protein
LRHARLLTRLRLTVRARGLLLTIGIGLRLAIRIRGLLRLAIRIRRLLRLAIRICGLLRRCGLMPGLPGLWVLLLRR